MREICICWHGRVVIICFLVIRASQNNTYSVCSIKRVGGRNLCILRECTLLTLYFHFKLCMLFSPLSITFIILIFFKLKGQKSREPERKARCGHWPVPRGWRMDGQGNKTCWRLAEANPKEWVTLLVFQWQQIELLWTGTRVLLGYFPENRKTWGEKRKDNLAGLRAKHAVNRKNK